MTPYFTTLAAAFSLVMLSTVATEAAPKRHLIWQDHAVAVPGLDSFKKISASAWDVDPTKPLPVQTVPGTDLGEKGRQLRGQDPKSTDRGWY